MSKESKKEKKIAEWNFNETEYHPDSGRISVKGNIKYEDGSVESKNIEVSPPEHTSVEQGGKISVSDVLSYLDNEMKEKLRKQEEEVNKD